MPSYNVVTQVASTSDDGWSGSVGLPTFSVDAATPSEAAVKALEIVGWPGTDRFTFGTSTDTYCSATAEGDEGLTTYHLSVAEVFPASVPSPFLTVADGVYDPGGDERVLASAEPPNTPPVIYHGPL